MNVYFVLGWFTSTALYGMLAFGVSVLFLDVGAATIFDHARHPVGVEGWFCKYMVVSLVAYVVLMLIHLLMVKIGIWRRGSSPYEGAVAGAVPSWVLADLTNPFRGLRALWLVNFVGTRGVYRAASVGGQIVHFVWSVALLGWLALGFASLPT